MEKSRNTAHTAYLGAIVVSVVAEALLAFYMVSAGRTAGDTGIALIPFGIAAFVSGLGLIMTSQSSAQEEMTSASTNLS